MVFKTSIIILTFNNLDYTRQCLESIYAATPLEDFKVVVVDNASQDETPSFLQEFAHTHPNLQCILNRENHGFAGGNNQGIDLALGEYIVFLNNDVVVTRGWLEGLVAHLQDPKVGMVGPVTNSAGNECRIPVDYQDLSGVAEFAARYTASHRGQSFEIKMLPMHCVALRRRTVDEIGGLDERFGLGMFEDDDYAIRLKQAGYRIHCVEDVFVHHFGSASFSRLGAAAYWRLFIENRKKFEEKWGVRWQPHMLRPEMISQQVEELVEGSIYLGGIAASQEEVINQFSEQLKERDQQNLEMVRQREELDQKNSQLTVDLEKLTVDLENREAYIAEVHRSRAWHLIQFIWRVRLFLLPPNSLRIEIIKILRQPARLRDTPMSGFILQKMGINNNIRVIMGRILKRIFTPQIKNIIVRLSPRGLQQYYKDLIFNYPFIDHSKVTLYTDTEICSDYLPRHSLSQCPEETPKPIKITLISTTRNEASSAQVWLESLLQQRRLPDELVIVDGGSTDATVKIIREIAAAFPFPIMIIEAPGANISKGRNIAIKQASHPYIACSDFGSTLDKNWLRYLIRPFELDETIEVSAGSYEGLIRDKVDRICSRFFVAESSKLNPHYFLPSSRSLAMKKDFWEKTGGYPEWLTDAGEDTLFDFLAKFQFANWAFVPEAKVYWRAPRTTQGIIRTIFRYSRGDGESGIFSTQYLQKAKDALWTNSMRLILVAIFILAIFLFGYWGLFLLIGLFIPAYKLYRTIRHTEKNLNVNLQLSLYNIWVAWIINTIQPLGFAVGVKNRSGINKTKCQVYASRLQKILENHPHRMGVIVYPPTHDWGFMFQRPHQIARSFSHEGYLYFFCTNNEKTDTVFGFREIEPGLYLSHVPLDVFNILENPIVYVGASWHVNRLSQFNHPKIIYDHYDDLDVSSGSNKDHLALLDRADIVLVTSQKLMESVNSYRQDAILVPNGVDYLHIKASHPRPDALVPVDFRLIIEKGHPIIGYSGALAEWFDYELLKYLARSRPDFEFILIGVNYDQSLDRSGVLDINNVHWLGMKPYSQLFQYVWRFDVAIIPFKINKITLATSPIKLFEYMACRLPVVTTALPECKKYPEILVAETKEQFVERLDTGLRLKMDKEYLDILEQTACDNTWDSRVKQIIAHLSGKPQ
jgi:GT2 family glycosyltransferase/glycosyltransferase involved in cell wall biosynthesis